jgi:hypothetical protein
MLTARLSCHDEAAAKRLCSRRLSSSRIAAAASQRLDEERLSTNTTYIGDMMFGAWARKPD